MPTKTDRILSYLPGAFRALPRPTALYSVADAFGQELLKAENSLAALMLAHWVDHADRGEELIQDLACIASLYGLRPRGADPIRPDAGQKCQPTVAEESVEEFREHLKRFVRTFLEGTVTTQGILRVTAEALGLHINDDYDEMDTWWTREDDSLASIVPRGDDAARLLLGVEIANIHGHPAQPAKIAGRKEIFGEIDLGEGAVLHLKIDNADPVKVELPPKARLDQIVEAINATLAVNVVAHGHVASREGNRLALTSAVVGPSGQIEILETPGDAALKLLDAPPRVYHGSAPTRARVSSPHFDGPVDLREARFLRLVVDGKLLAEVDCAAKAADARQAKLEDIAKTVNEAFSKAVLGNPGLETDLATQANGVLTLTSPTEGPAGSIEFQSAAAQDARKKLFGEASTFHIGSSASRARATGLRDLSLGVDLSVRSLIRIQVDGRPAITIDCKGETPASTSLVEIALAINGALNAPVASHDGRFIILDSEQTGPAARIEFLSLPEEQGASDIIFGVIPRIVRGSFATSARLVGALDLSGGANLGALNKLRLGIDGAYPKEIDLRSAAADPTELVTPAEIAEAINDAFDKQHVASDDGKHLIIASPSAGSLSRIVIEPLEVKRRRRFVTRAFISDETGPKLFGFPTARAQGGDATRARLVGSKDLSRGVDLRTARYLRLKIDENQPIEVDCAGKRPRVTELKEVIGKINEAVKTALGLDESAPPFAASPDNKRIALTSPRAGASSRIIFEDPRGVLSLFGFEPGVYRGSKGAGVNFIGAADLSKGVDLSAGGKIKLGVNDKPPVEIDCAKQGDPQRTTLNDIVAAINTAIGSEVAKHDGQRITINSPAGPESRVEFVAPSSGDATHKIFGVAAPRLYRGAKDEPARVVSALDLSAGVDLRAARTLRLKVDNQNPAEVDCGALAVAQPDEEGDPRAAVKLQLIVTAIKGANVGVEARAQNNRLVIETETTGEAALLELLTFPGDDGRQTLLGEPETTPGAEATPAQIAGEADLIAPVNLTARGVIRVAVDGGRPVEIDVSGSAPQNTLLIEVVDRINSIFPGLASATDDNQLTLTSPTAGDTSSLELESTGALELIEFPPAKAAFPAPDQPAFKARHGDSFTVNNDGAASSRLRIEIYAPQGASKPAFVNRTDGQIVRLEETLLPGERAVVWSEDGVRLRASITSGDGAVRAVPGSHIAAAPLAPLATVPFYGERALARNDDLSPATLILRNPLAPRTLTLRARDGKEIAAGVAEANLNATYEGLTAAGQLIELDGRVRFKDGQFYLAAAGDKRIAQLRPGIDLRLSEYLNRAVRAAGTLHQTGDDAQPENLLVVERLAVIFDVTIASSAATESYAGVTIGHGAGERDSLDWRINFSDPPSQIVRAFETDQGEALILPVGQSHWSYVDCDGARFDQAWFDRSAFAGVLYEACEELKSAECGVKSFCEERGVFDVSRFTNPSTPDERTVFAPAPPLDDPQVEIRFRWMRHQPGAFIVNLPADLPDEFGGRFDRARFASSGDAVEKYTGVITEPADDPESIINRLQASGLVKAEVVQRVEIGFTAVPLPIRQPGRRKLRGGDADNAARIYLSEKDVPGFIKLTAARGGEAAAGAYGNEIVVTARKSDLGPARYDVTISYQGGRFENARLAARGGDRLPPRIEDYLRPGAVGVLQAKAAGVQAEVTRDGARDLDQLPD